MVAVSLWVAKDLIVVFLSLYLVMKELPKDLKGQGTVMALGVRIRRSMYCAFSSYAAAWVIVFVPLILGFFAADAMGANVGVPTLGDRWGNAWKWAGYIWPVALCGIAITRSYSVAPQISGLSE